MNTEDRLCVECEEITEHLVEDEPVRCTACNAPATVESLGDCAISSCPNVATHLVVLTSDRVDQQPEAYCDSHIRGATDGARADPRRDVDSGPENRRFD